MSEIDPTLTVPEELRRFYDAVPQRECARVLRDYWDSHEDDGTAGGAAEHLHQARLARAEQQAESEPARAAHVALMMRNYQCPACGEYSGSAFRLCPPCQRITDAMLAAEAMTDTDRVDTVRRYLTRGNLTAMKENQS